MEKSMFPRKFVEWILFTKSSIYPVEINKFWNGRKDKYETLDELYFYWLTEIKNKDGKS